MEETAQEDELAEVVGVVVDEEDGFRGQGLVVGVGDGGKEVGFFDRREEFLAIGAEGSDGPLPGFGIGRLGRLGPVTTGKTGRFVLGIADVFDDIPLGDAEVFDQLPGGVGQIVGASAAKIGGKVFDGGIEAGVGVFFNEVRDEFVPEGVGLFCRFGWQGSGPLKDWMKYIAERSHWKRQESETVARFRSKAKRSRALPKRRGMDGPPQQ